MADDIMKIGNVGLTKEFLNEIGDFQKRLNSDPNPKDIEINDLASTEKKKIKFVPIGSIERLLDEKFSGLYSITIQEIKIVANEIIVHARIKYFHPIAQTWLERDGIGAVQIRWKQGVDITDLNGKLKTALQMDAPHAYAEAVKNAAKKIGSIFGRSINRDDDYSRYQELDDFLDLLSDEDMEEINNDLKNAKTRDELIAVWKKYPDYNRFVDFKTVFMKRRKELGV